MQPPVGLVHPLRGIHRTLFAAGDECLPISSGKGQDIDKLNSVDIVFPDTSFETPRNFDNPSVLVLSEAVLVIAGL